MIYLNTVRIKDASRQPDEYPFTLPVVRQPGTLTLKSPVTFFVGENGAGKSTLLEAIAVASGSIAVGGEDLVTDSTLRPVRELASQLALGWRKRTHRGFFLRVEDFFNFASRMEASTRELDELAESYTQPEMSYGARLAQGAMRGKRPALTRNYGANLHTRSHGEAFLQVFQSRFVPGGLYLLDEPDTALSPLRQLAFLAMLSDMVQQEAQFIIASHSPMLMAFAEATIFKFDEHGITGIEWHENDNVILMRDFLNNPELFLRQL